MSENDIDDLNAREHDLYDPDIPSLEHFLNTECVITQF